LSSATTVLVLILLNFAVGPMSAEWVEVRVAMGPGKKSLVMIRTTLGARTRARAGTRKKSRARVRARTGALTATLMRVVKLRRRSWPYQAWPTRKTAATELTTHFQTLLQTKK
jgi:hypothetical protein